MVRGNFRVKTFASREKESCKTQTTTDGIDAAEIREGNRRAIEETEGEN